MTDFLEILRQRLAPEVFDQSLATNFIETLGPFDLSRIIEILDTLLAVEPPNLHLSFYLEHIQNQLTRGISL